MKGSEAREEKVKRNKKYVILGANHPEITIVNKLCVIQVSSGDSPEQNMILKEENRNTPMIFY